MRTDTPARLPKERSPCEAVRSTRRVADTGPIFSAVTDHLSLPFFDETIDALFEAGCDDGTFGTVDQVGYADFVREAPTFGQAVRSAIEQVESVPGLAVLRVEPEDLVTMNEIADRMGRSRESVRLLIKGARGPGGFPPPASHLKARSRLWRWSEVAAWAEDLPQSIDRRASALIATINAALILRANASRLSPEDRKLVAKLI